MAHPFREEVALVAGHRHQDQEAVGQEVVHPFQAADRPDPSGALRQGHQGEDPQGHLEVDHPDPQVQAEGQAAVQVVPQEAVPHSQRVPVAGCTRSGR